MSSDSAGGGASDVSRFPLTGQYKERLEERLNKATCPDAVLPKALYHYTSLEVLMLMAFQPDGGNWNRIRASSIAFMNDSKEFSWGRDQILEWLRQKHISDRNDPCQIHRLVSRDEPKHIAESVLVTCFSTKPDDLNQWRAYASDGAGVAIGYDYEGLLKAVGDKGILVKVIYDVNGKTQSLPRQIAWELMMMSNAAKKSQIGRVVSELECWLPTFIAKASACMKHKAFKSEREYRFLFLEPKRFSGIGIQYRTNGGRVVPYLDIDCEKLPVTDIRLGPRIKNPTSIFVLKNMDWRLGDPKVEGEVVAADNDNLIQESEVPYA